MSVCRFIIASLFFLTQLLFAQTNAGCVSEKCHAGIVTKPVVHAPAAEDCAVCHEQHNDSQTPAAAEDFTLMEAAPDLCYACHEEPTSPIHVWHSAQNKNCVLCHSPHSSEAAFLLSTSEPENCKSCHSSVADEAEYVHAPAEEGECLMCHQPDESRTPFVSIDVPGLCYECHDDKQAIAESDYPHAAVEECLECHNPHSSNNPAIAKLKAPVLCYQCHEDMQLEAESLPSVHGAIKDDGACISCHDPHGEQRPTLLKREPQDLCLSCHNQEIKGEDRLIPDIQAKLSQPVVHAAIEMDGCGTCHLPHFSENGHLLNSKFPFGHYGTADENDFMLCFNCHDSELMTSEKTTATGFRNGKKNLHYLHLNGEKARSCTNCHDVHGSNNNHLIRDHFDFGRWEIIFDFKENQNGGSCNIGCHAEKHYSRE